MCFHPKVLTKKSTKKKMCWSVSNKCQEKDHPLCLLFRDSNLYAKQFCFADPTLFPLCCFDISSFHFLFHRIILLHRTSRFEIINSIYKNIYIDYINWSAFEPFFAYHIFILLPGNITIRIHLKFFLLFYFIIVSKEMLDAKGMMRITMKSMNWWLIAVMELLVIDIQKLRKLIRNNVIEDNLLQNYDSIFQHPFSFLWLNVLKNLKYSQSNSFELKSWKHIN